MSALKQNKIDFLRRSREDYEKSAKRKRGLVLALPFIIAVLILGGIESYYLCRIHFSLNPYLDELQSYTQDVNTLSQYSKSLLLQSEKTYLDSSLKNLEKAEEAVTSYPDLTKEIINGVYSCAGSSVSVGGVQYDRETALLTLKCTSDGMSRVPDFIEALKKAGYFGDSVIYYGETAKIDQETGSYQYDFTVYCIVSGGGAQ